MPTNKLIQYTEEMERYDYLYWREKENPKEGKRLILEIMEQAKQLGYKGVFTIYDYELEGVDVLLNTSEEEHREEIERGTELETYGSLKALINFLNMDMNSQTPKYFNIKKE